MKPSNKRRHKRLRIDRSVKIPVHLFSKIPFIGPAVHAVLINLSTGGIALTMEMDDLTHPIPRGTELKIHFRLPGRSLQECRGVVSHSVKSLEDQFLLGIKFENCPNHLKQELESMAADNDACDYRIEQSENPWCVPNCSFFELCRKPIRPASHHSYPRERLEIALQVNE